MYCKRKVITSDWLYREVMRQAGNKQGYTDPDKDINRTVEVLAPMLFYETVNVQPASPEEDIYSGIDAYVKNEPIQVKCSMNPHLILEDFSNGHVSCWDNCDAKSYLHCYVSEKHPGRVIVDEYLVSEVKRILFEVRRKHKAFPNGYGDKAYYWGSDYAFGRAYYKEWDNGRTSFFMFCRDDDPRD